MKLKIDEDGKVVVDEESGNPMYISEEDGKETNVAVDVPSLFVKIKELNGEAKTHRLARNGLAEKLKPAEAAGIEDLDAFIKKAGIDAETISNFDEKDFKSAKEVEAIKKGVSDSFQDKLDEAGRIQTQMKVDNEASIVVKDAQIRKLLIKGAFDRSSFIKDNTVLLSDIAYDSFGKNFAIEEEGVDLKIFAKDRFGEKIFSKANPGEYAGPEEAIELIIKDHPQSSEILRASGGGDDSSTTPSRNTGDFTNADLAKLPPSERLKVLHQRGIKK